MVTTKNRAARGAGPALLVVIVLCLGGCQPSGPRSLLKGEQLIHKGRYGDAVEQLETAVRLLPQNAQAWNHLGLAYHGSGRPPDALRAYQKALALDHKLAAAHYNLGCLHLEQNHLAAALNELTTFTGLESASLDGWLKLGNAQLRAGRIDAAEKSYRTALDLQPRHVEALNGLGVIKYQRRRTQEALDLFNAALAQSPNYGPALLNAAVLLHQTLNSRPAALQKYRQYLALKPRPANWEPVEAAARQLESDLNPEVAPPPARPILSQATTQQHAAPVVAAVRTNPTSHASASRSAPPAATNRAPAMASAAGAPPRSNAVTSAPPRTNAVALTLPRTNLFAMAQASRQTSAPASTRPGIAPPEIKAPSNSFKPAAAPSATAPADNPPEVQVTRLSDDLAIKPPQDIAQAAPSQAEPADAPRADAPSVAVAPRNAKPPRRGFLDRINPFKGRAKPATNSLVVSPLPDGGTGAASPSGEPSPGASVPPPPPAPPDAAFVVARYNYVSPGKPPAGDRTQAENLTREGVKAQQAGKLTQALALYKSAVRADPSFFEAQFNEGLAAYELGNFKNSLTAYEYALAIRPESVDARYNFALALKRGNYPLDAAEQFERLLQAKPDEARAEYSLATLYAHQLNAPARAKPHFQKVLDLNPRHPEAGQIRFWLAQNP
jgi:tetratricopeptide (TPR) repeat protein